MPEARRDELGVRALRDEKRGAAIPFYEPGGRLTAYATVALTGKRFVALDVAKLNGNYKVKLPTAGGWCLGVVSHDAPANSKVTVLCDPGMVVPALAAVPLTAGTEVDTDATGQVVPHSTGVSLGRVMADCPAGQEAEVKLR